MSVQSNIEVAEPEPKRRRTWAEVVCPHCSDRVSKTTFYRHKKLYYSRQTGQWQRTSAEHTDVDATNDACDTSIESDGHSAEETDLDQLTMEETATLTTTPSMLRHHKINSNNNILLLLL